MVQYILKTLHIDVVHLLAVVEGIENKDKMDYSVHLVAIEDIRQIAATVTFVESQFFKGFSGREKIHPDHLINCSILLKAPAELGTDVTG
jgi:hypothetical protein